MNIEVSVPMWLSQKTVRVGKCDRCGFPDIMKKRKCDQIYDEGSCNGKLIYSHTARIVGPSIVRKYDLRKVSDSLRDMADEAKRELAEGRVEEFP